MPVYVLRISEGIFEDDNFDFDEVYSEEIVFHSKSEAEDYMKENPVGSVIGSYSDGAEVKVLSYILEEEGAF